MWYRIKSFLKFYFGAVTKFNVQSPFLYDFVINILDTDREYYIFNEIEKQRKRLLHTQAKINLTDYGAGSKSSNQKTKTVGTIAKHSLSSISKCRTLFNLIQHYHFRNVLELGTSLGISAAYLASSDSKTKVFTLEGDPEIANIALETHQNLHFKNIEIVVGKFENTLLDTLEKIGKIDVAFIDGHHEQEATCRYFEQILPSCHNDSIIVVDDIYWSPGMTKAWTTLSNHPKVTLSIDLYDIGILFLKPELSRQKVAYIPYLYKPWRIGLFGD